MQVKDFCTYHRQEYIRKHGFESKVKCLSDMLNSNHFQIYHSDLLGNDLFINDPDRASRIYEYAETGSDGSTHDEIISDWRDYLQNGGHNFCACLVKKIENEISACETWHIENGSIDKVIG